MGRTSSKREEDQGDSRAVDPRVFRSPGRRDVDPIVTRPGIDKGYGVRKLHETLGTPKSADMVSLGDAVFPGGNDSSGEAGGRGVDRGAGPARNEAGHRGRDSRVWRAATAGDGDSQTECGIGMIMEPQAGSAA